MANKQDYMAKGRADAVAGKPRAVEGSDTWQTRAYQAGYTEGVMAAQDELAAPKGELVELFRRTVSQASRRAVADAQKRLHATMKRSAHRARMAAHKKEMRAIVTPRGDSSLLSHNITRKPGRSWA